MASDYLNSIGLLFLTYAISYLVGTVILFRVTILSEILRVATRVLVGYFFTISFIAGIYCNALSYCSPIFILLGLYVVYNLIYSKSESGNFTVTISLRSLTTSVILIVVTWIITCIFFFPYAAENILFNNLDYGFYGYCGEYIVKNGIESTFWGDALLAPGKRAIYHYIDLWHSGLLHHLFDTNSYIIYLLVVKVFYTSLLLLFVMSMFDNLSGTWKTVLFTCGLLFISNTLFFIPNSINKWYLKFTYYPSLINYHGGLYAILLIVASLLLYRTHTLLSQLLLLILSTSHALMPFVVLTHFGLLIVYDLVVLKKINYRYGALVLLCLGILGYQLAITQYMHGGNPIIISNILKAFFAGTGLSLFEFSIICLAPFLGFVLFIKDSKTSSLHFVSIVCASIISYGLLVDIFKFDTWQIKIIAILAVVITFGYVEIAKRVLIQNKPLYSILFTAFIIASCYLSLCNKKYYFGNGPIYGENEEKIISIPATSLDELRSILLTGNGGTFYSYSGFPNYLYMPPIIEVTQYLNSSNVIYRLNTCRADTSTPLKRASYKEFVQSEFPVISDADSMNAYTLIDKLDIKWFYESKNDLYVLPGFIKNRFGKKQEFGDVIIYTAK